MKKYKVAILGATGAVGQQMIKVLEERRFPVSELIPLASARSAGKTLEFCGQQIVIKEACDEAFDGVDIVLGAAENDIAKRFAPAIVKAGAVFVDNSSAFRLDDDVPLVVPEVNAEDVKWHKGIIANPNCVTIIAQQVEALGKGESFEPKTFQYQIAYNLIPQIGGEKESGYTSEEMKLQYEGRKIMHNPDMLVSCTCVRVPVIRSHSISMNLRFDRHISVEQARNAIADAPGCMLVDDLANKRYPMPLETSDQDIVFVGRIRPDLTDDNSLCLWCCGDQVRKGAATNAIQIAELLIEE